MRLLVLSIEAGAVCAARRGTHIVICIPIPLSCKRTNEREHKLNVFAFDICVNIHLQKYTRSRFVFVCLHQRFVKGTKNGEKKHFHLPELKNERRTDEKKNYVEKFWNWYKKRENTNTGWERWVETKINLLCKLSRCVYLFVLCVGTRMRAILRATCSSHLNWIVLWVARIHFRFERCLDRETSSKLRNSRKVNIYCITLLSFNMSSYFGFQIPRYT